MYLITLLKENTAKCYCMLLLRDVISLARSLCVHALIRSDHIPSVIANVLGVLLCFDAKGDFYAIYQPMA